MASIKEGFGEDTPSFQMSKDLIFSTKVGRKLANVSSMKHLLSFHKVSRVPEKISVSKPLISKCAQILKRLMFSTNIGDMLLF